MSHKEEMILAEFKSAVTSALFIYSQTIATS